MLVWGVAASYPAPRSSLHGVGTSRVQDHRSICLCPRPGCSKHPGASKSEPLVCGGVLSRNAKLQVCPGPWTPGAVHEMEGRSGTLEPERQPHIKLFRWGKCKV